jgi:ADP-ribose pyrophosphatase
MANLMNFKVTKSESKFKGRVFELRVDEIEYDSGNKGVRETAVHPGGAVVLALKNNGKIILVKQYRYPHDKYLLELPAGKLEKGEEPLTCAVRELTEETGYTAKEMIKLGAIFTSPGFCSEVLHIYLAKDLIPGSHNREEGEYGMEIHEYTLDEINKMITSGDIVDAKTICGIHYYSLLLKK